MYILLWFAPDFVNYKKGARDSQSSANDKVYQLLAHGRWFSLGIPASSTTKTGRHDNRTSTGEITRDMTE
jgi:hypothetical protein